MSNRSNSQGNGFWWSTLWAGGAQKRIQQIQRIRDDGTTADEVLALTRDRLIPLSLLFSLSFCIFFYYRFLSDAYPIWVAIPGAIIIAFIIENGKIFFGIRAVRYLYFHRPLSSIADTILFIGIVAFAVLAFYWSVKNSTSGLHDLTSRTVHENSYKTLVFSPDVSSIDRQISDVRAAQQRAGKMLWKGKITVEGQRLLRRSEESINKLQDQRLTMIRQAEKRYDTDTKAADTNTERAASWTRLIGGFIEACQVLLLIIAGSCEKKLDDRLNAGKENDYAASNNPLAYHQPYTAPIGFNVDQAGNVRSASRPVNGIPNPPPPDLYHNVPQGNTSQAIVGSDEAVKHYHTLLGREVANLRNDNGRVHTIIGRMNKSLIEFGRVVQSKGFNPKKQICTDMYIFLENTVFTTMNDHRRAYEYAAALLKDLYSHIDQKEYETRKQEQPQA